MGKKKTIVTAAVLSLAAAFLLISGGMVYAATEAAAVNLVETGIVDISLYELMEKEGFLVPFENDQVILPGKVISKIPVLENAGIDCYVRFKLEFTKGQEDLERAIFGWNDNIFLGEDGYYYAKDIVETKDTFELFEGIRIPTDYPQENEGKKVVLTITAEAVQAAHFAKEETPETMAENGSAAVLNSGPNESEKQLYLAWQGLEVEKCRLEDVDIDELKTADHKGFSLQYEGGAKRLVLSDTDLFSNFSYMVPGDTFRDQTVLKNTSDQAVDLYFRTEDLENSELTDLLELTIYLEDAAGVVEKEDGKNTVSDASSLIEQETGETIYEGPLRASDLNSNVWLLRLAPKSEAKLGFDLHMPETLKNKYSMENTRVKWIFSTEPVAEKTKTVQTSDAAQNKCFSILLFVSAAVLLLSMAIYLKGRRRYR